MIRAAVLGKPVGHSLSPLVHGFIYRELGLSFEYQRIEVDEREASELIKNAFKSFQSFNVSADDITAPWSGFSLTMPLKEIGFDLDLPVEERAIEAHSINTITPLGAFNTDITGLIRVFAEEAVSAEHLVILGNGATARSVLVASDALQGLREITVFRRDPSRDHFLPLVRGTGVRIRSFAEIENSFFGADTLLVSTIPGSAQGSISLSFVGFEGTLVDFSYAPWPSTLAGVVKGRVISGLPILVSQAVDQALHFTGMDFDVMSMYRTALSSTVHSIAR